jgi:hypothetical protein
MFIGQIEIQSVPSNSAAMTSLSVMTDDIQAARARDDTKKSLEIPY